MILLFFGLRLVRIGIRRINQKPRQEKDLLVETLRAQTLKEKQAVQEQIKTNQALDSLNQLHHQVLENLPLSILKINPSGLVQYTNGRAVELLGEHLVGRLLNEAAPNLSQHLQQFGHHPDPPPVSFQAETDIRILACRCLELPDGGTLITLDDQTRVRMLEERVRLKRDLEIMGELAGGITHEVKNALAVIQGHAQMLAYGDVEQRAKDITGEVEHLLKFTRDFLKFSKSTQIDFQEIQLNVLFDHLETHLQRRPHYDRILIENQHPDGSIFGDETLLITVLDNLIQNGIHACEGMDVQGPMVTVTTTRSKEFLLITITDQGPGFPIGVREKKFSPFITTKTSGSGLGLYHSRRIMLEHGGDLLILDGPPTQIQCRFPLQPPPNGSEL